MSDNNRKSTLTLDEYQKVFTENVLADQLHYEGSEDFFGHFIPLFDKEESSNEAVDRFGIYRNNVILSLSVAIADTFPVVKRLIGDRCFEAAAIAFVRKHPPAQPSLLFYGKEFIHFIKDYPACTELGYLSDIAQLEWNYIRAFHAKDSTLLENETLQQIALESLGDAAFDIHPSVQLMQSDWPIDTIWEENLKQDVEIIDLEKFSKCKLLIYRQELHVQVVNLTPECFHFLLALTEGKSILDAWSYTLEQQQLEQGTELNESELSGMLGYLLSLSLFTSVKLNTT
ncbi:MAG: DUF2063 domain-containing protein [Gammaproteobacteria bacterium]|nr:DUF2063 domain-containing protein [Gammaproteobacteria bacterium]